MKDKVIAICPGSFDPVTYGHLDIITRASKMFQKVIVVVAYNSSKNYSFTPDERVEMIRKCVQELDNVETLFLTTAAENMYLSSSMVKQIASMGGEIDSFVPEVIRQDIINRIKN